jgi:hypothetical protein
MRRIAIPLAACLVAGLAPVVWSVPASSSDQAVAPPATALTQAPDYKLPPPGTPATKLPSRVRTRGELSYKPGSYDIHILAVGMSTAAVPWDEAEARSQVEALDAWFARETDGLFRFRLAGFRVMAPYSGEICDVDVALEHVKAAVAQLRPSPGVTDVLPVVLTGETSDKCPYGGMARLGAPGAWVSSEDPSDGFETNTLIHEIGHNFKLRHSATVTSSNASLPWAPNTDPEMVTYGDAADVMGIGGQYDCDSVVCRFNISALHGHNRNLLGAVPSERIAYIPMPASATEPPYVIDLVDAGSSLPGFEIAYLPWLNRSKFFIEYRPAIGGDAHIGDEGGPGAGVQVRLIDTELSAGPVPYPPQRWSGRFGTIGMSAGLPRDEYWNVPMGRGAGSTLTLPDGTLIEVLSTTGESASVRVSRPADVTPPTMTRPTFEYLGGECRSFPCTVPASAARSGKYRVWLAYGALDDNQWVDYADALVNGKRLLYEDRVKPDGTDEEMSFSPGSDGWGHYERLAPGSYTLAYSYRDLSGNVGTATYRVVLPKPKKKR